MQNTPGDTSRNLLLTAAILFTLAFVAILWWAWVAVMPSTTAEISEAEKAAVEARLKPVGRVNTGDVALAAVAAAPAEPRAGKAIYDGVCTACHTTGAAGAPKFGDQAAWAPRVAKGEDALLHSLLNGLNAMPAKGGDAKLSEDEAKGVLAYMLSGVGVQSKFADAAAPAAAPVEAAPAEAAPAEAAPAEAAPAAEAAAPAEAPAETPAAAPAGQ